MNNIEKLAIEHGITITPNGYAGETDLLNVETAEAFAKALQSSEPVAYIDTKMFNSPHLLVNGKCVDPLEWVRSFEKSTNIFTHPPVQSSEPVAVVRETDPYQDGWASKHIKCLVDIDSLVDDTKLFTHPPSSVPLEKYNKLLEQRNDAIKALGDLSFECFAGIGLTQPSVKTYNETFKTLDRLRKAIAEAEGKEG